MLAPGGLLPWWELSKLRACLCFNAYVGHAGEAGEGWGRTGATHGPLAVPSWPSDATRERIPAESTYFKQSGGGF
eukprot:1948080-Alexandrium_andersonii.AAC.1